MRKRCVFCQMPNVPEDRQILYENDILYVIQDIKPCAYKHFLVISKRHIYDCKSLKKKDLALLNEMEEVGRNILKQNGVEDNYRIGFHNRPFTSVHHLHLHCIGLPFNGCWSKFAHSPPFLISVDKIRQRLQYTFLFKQTWSLKTTKHTINL